MHGQNKRKFDSVSNERFIIHDNGDITRVDDKRNKPIKRSPKRSESPKRPDPPKKQKKIERLDIIIINSDELLNNKFNPNVNNNTNKDKKPVPALTIENICTNPLCDHTTNDENPTKNVMPNITQINDINDLIKLGKTYHCKKNKEYNGINLRILCNLITPLKELQKMVGMKSVKTNIVNQILFFLQGFNKNGKCNNCVDCSFDIPCARNHTDMLHTVITGPPGVGKTELGKILGKIYKEMGILSKGHFNLVSRADLVAGYLGQTAIKTQKKIDECMGGIMFIDEAYSLGHSEKRDSFSKECLDTLNQNLTERRDFLCIIAGYKNELEECFFKSNEGLRRRFTFRYDIESYNGEELKEIFINKLKKDNWDLEFNVNVKDDRESIISKNIKIERMVNLFKNNKNNFMNYGGDMETLFLNCKIYHSKRMIFGAPKERRLLTIEDIENGFKTYLASRQKKNKNNNYVPKSLWN